MSTSNSKTATVVSYDYPHDGGYADTVATLSDGRRVWINTQYKTINVKHTADCAKSKIKWAPEDNVCTMGAKERATACTCGMLDGIDSAALIADARINGKTGNRPTPRETPAAKEARERGLREYDEHKAKMDKIMGDDNV